MLVLVLFAEFKHIYHFKILFSVLFLKHKSNNTLFSRFIIEVVSHSWNPMERNDAHDSCCPSKTSIKQYFFDICHSIKSNQKE